MGRKGVELGLQSKRTDPPQEVPPRIDRKRGLREQRRARHHPSASVAFDEARCARERAPVRREGDRSHFHFASKVPRRAYIGPLRGRSTRHSGRERIGSVDVRVDPR